LAISGVAVLDVVDCGLRGASALVDADFITEVYPNPADNSINVRIVNTEVSYIQIEVLDLEGRVVYSTKHNAQDGNNLEVDCSNFSSGMYLMKINTDTKSEEFKIAVQHQ
jgi:polyisoprenoid-binding protein YceI